MDTTRFAHHVPFGANVLADGTTLFRLWAPQQTKVSLRLEPSGRSLPMERLEDGWFELRTESAPAGTHYFYEMSDGFRVPDPASRCQAEDAHGASVVVDPLGYDWRNPDWSGRPWEETVLYELHVGTFTPEGTFDGVRKALDHFVRLGVTAIELMPIADFPGRRNWGYDGVLMFAPDRAYGDPESLKRLIDEAHGKGLMVFLDVVYNHFGPDGNYLHLYAKDFFTDRHKTPWGDAIDFSRQFVRDFYVANTLYWLEEFRFDGLRYDAVHAIVDDGRRHILTEIAETVRKQMPADRHVHLVLENDDNEAKYLSRDPAGRPVHYTAQWNDDFHHVQHVLLTGEKDGYYEDFTGDTIEHLVKSLTEGFVYQGEASQHRGGSKRGEPSVHLPPLAFVDFMQNHDQVGNRAFGDRLAAYCEPGPIRAMAAILLLAPAVPLLFMGEEWGAEETFPFFCDFQGDLADAVREGRRREFAKFEAFADPAAREKIPDPTTDETFDKARLTWPQAGDARAEEFLTYYRALLALRQEAVVPLLKSGIAQAASRRWGATGLSVTWAFRNGARLTLVANPAPQAADGCPRPAGSLLTESAPGVGDAASAGSLPAWSTAWYLVAAGSRG